MPRRLKELSEFKTVRDIIINDYVEYTGKTAFINEYYSEDGTRTDVNITYEQLYNDVKALGTFLTRELFLANEQEQNSDTDSDNFADGRMNESIAIIGDNSYFCALAALTVMSGIGASVMVGRSTSDTKITEIFSDLDIKYAFVQPEYAKRVPQGVRIFSLDDNSMKEYLSLGENDQEATDMFMASPISEDYDTCLVLSTNGEHGRRKFAKLTNKNISLMVLSLQKKIKISHSDKFVSILPIALYSEFVTDLIFPLSRGACVVYSNRMSDPSSVLKDNDPTMLVSTPDFISEVYSSIWSNLQKSGNEKAAVNFIRMVENAGQVRRGVKQSVFNEIREALGGGLRNIISVSDCLPSRTRSGMKAFGIPIIDVYGMAECPVISIKLPTSDSDKSLGDPIPGISITINSAEHGGIGNICIKGEAISKGYCNDRHNKKYVLRDGRISTGDIGTLSSDGKIHLIGKKTTAFESPKAGKVIFPEQLENALCCEPNIAEALVYSEKATSDDGSEVTEVCASIMPERSFVELHGQVAAKKMVRDSVDRINSIILPYKRITKYSITFERAKRTAAHRLERDLFKH